MRDPSANFGEAAGRYEAFRPSYPPDVFEFLLKHAASGRVRAVDLGAGTGQATRALAGLFDRVSAVEPDARLAQAARLPENADLIVQPAETADFAPDSIDAVIAATAFHWMDQPLICRNAVRWLKSGGVFFPFAFEAFEVEGAAGDFYNAEFRKWTTFRDRRLLECYDYVRALEESDAFDAVIPFASRSRHEIAYEAAAGLISTFSFARDYARAEGGEDYFERVAESLSGFGETVSFSVPVIGALGVKG